MDASGGRAWVSAERFESALHARLRSAGFAPVAERFPLAGHELGMLDFRALARAAGGRTFVVAVRRADGFVREQLRILSDQYFNALGREKNALERRPTLVRGICIFTYEHTPAEDIAQFLMDRVRPRTPLAVIRSVPWIFDLMTGRLRRPLLTSRPFSRATLDRALADARVEAAAALEPAAGS